MEKIKNQQWYLRYFIIISPWEKRGPSFEQTWIPFTQGWFVPSLVEIGWLKLAQWFWKRRWKREKFTTTTTTDNRQILIRKAHLSLRLRWAKIHEEIPWFQYTGKSTPCILAQVTNKNFQALLFKTNRSTRKFPNSRSLEV